MIKLLVLFSFLAFSIASFADPKASTTINTGTMTSSTHITTTNKDDERQAKKVIMFSATYCPNCLNAKQFLSTQGIPFMEFDIEKSAAARSYFDKLGGRGTPFLLVNNHPIQGFNQAEFWRYYKKQ